jgi:hypothetical protein
MKLKTEIPPRKNGTLVLTGPNGVEYTCVLDEDGDLAVEVGDEEFAHQLIASGNFHPANQEDYDAVLAILDAGAESDDEDDDEIQSDPMAPPIEANTPLSPKNPKGKGRR